MIGTFTAYVPTSAFGYANPVFVTSKVKVSLSTLPAISKLLPDRLLLIVVVPSYALLILVSGCAVTVTFFGVISKMSDTYPTCPAVSS